MMSKSFSFSPLISGKTYGAIQNVSNHSVRDGGQLKMFSTSLTCSQLYPSTCVLAAKLTCIGTRSCRFVSLLQRRGSNSADVKPLNQLAAAPFSLFGLNRVEGSSPEPRSAPKFQPFRHRHASWLFLGLCICLSAAVGSFVPQLLIGSSPALAEALAKRPPIPTASSSRSQPTESEESHGKKVHFDFHVTGVPGDGRCLFRAVAHGACLKSGRPAPDESTQRQMADELRNRALDELIRRRETSEWFIEGDFDAYVRRMRLPHTWGGEPELLMLSHVLQMPITVYMKDKGGIISIAEYGQEYGNDDPVRVLYHGFGHYEALHLSEDRQRSRL
nr:OTU domain-containing protein At3g57810-like isoform X3 [Physcomitrium patens]|eukprot:XP_024398148.1 OTU domain-containing protein At3g57810-like isoform X3 [Physcomitrella patens]